jgi:divalent metal cation (Fe/Co/Zn/Cd) transporter
MDLAALTNLAVMLAATTHHKKHPIFGLVFLLIVIAITVFYVRYRREQTEKLRNLNRPDGGDPR